MVKGRKYMKLGMNMSYGGFALACFAVVQNVRGVSPAPDGGYPGGNTAEGQNALFSLSSGGYNTAVGFLSLRNDTTGDFNTANGVDALRNNTSGSNNTANGVSALLSNSTGDGNIALGYLAGTGQDPDASNNIFIGDHGVSGDINTIAIGIEGIH